MAKAKATADPTVSGTRRKLRLSERAAGLLIAVLTALTLWADPGLPAGQQNAPAAFLLARPTAPNRDDRRSLRVAVETVTQWSR